MLMKGPLLKSIFSLRHYSLSAENVLKTGGILKQARTFSDSDIAEYSKLTHDSNPLHFDLKCAKQAGFTEIPVPGMLVASLFPRIIAYHFPGAVYVKQELDFRSPVFVGDKVVGEVQAKSIRQIKEKFLDYDGKVTPEEVASAALYLKDTLDKEGGQELVSSLAKDADGKILVEDIVRLGSRVEDSNKAESEKM